MSSFSDAHECPEIPLIAANTALLTPARHNQIWAVLRAEDTRERLCYSLSAAMLGRMCLSGDVHRLADWQWAIVDESIAFYDRIRPILARSDQYVERRGAEEYRRLTGWQAVRREGETQYCWGPQLWRRGAWRGRSGARAPLADGVFCTSIPRR
jgi:alpha-galactosidase